MVIQLTHVVVSHDTGFNPASPIAGLGRRQKDQLDEYGLQADCRGIILAHLCMSAGWPVLLASGMTAIQTRHCIAEQHHIINICNYVLHAALQLYRACNPEDKQPTSGDGHSSITTSTVCSSLLVVSSRTLCLGFQQLAFLRTSIMSVLTLTLV